MLLVALVAAGPALAAERAVPADDFVDSIGINVHWAYDHYSRNWSVLKQKLAELGVRHQRDGAVPQAYDRARALYQDLGIKTLWITGRRAPGPWPQVLLPEQVPEEIAELRPLADLSSGIEGPNEYDIMRPESEVDWHLTLRRYQQTMYAAVRSDPGFDGVPVVGPSLTSSGAYERAGDYSDIIDATCIHHYQDTRHPGTPGWGDDGYGSIDWALRRLAGVQGPDEPGPWSTECGYNSNLGASVHPRYVNRSLAEFYRRGYVRSYKYELLGDQWGLLRGDLSETPAFSALKNLLRLLGDPGPAFVPGSLDFVLEGDLQDIRRLLFQKRDGRWYLVLWQEVASWDPARKVDLRPPERPVQLTLRGTFAGAAAYEPATSAQPIATWERPQVLKLQVPDHLLVVEISQAMADDGEQDEADAAGGSNPVPGDDSGLLGRYHTGTDPRGTPTFERIDARVDFDWGGGGPGNGVPDDHFSVRWSGFVEAPASEEVSFIVTADDGVRLWIDGRPVIDAWRDQAPTTLWGTARLEAGQRHSIRLDYYERGGGAVARLEWSSPSIARQVIPRSRLFPAAGAHILVNFQPASAHPVLGHLIDAGAPFADRGNGFSYGWNADNRAQARDRNLANAPDQRFDTLTHLQKAGNPDARWEIAVPNGLYDVRLVAGDAGYIDSHYCLSVEGQVVLDQRPTADRRWVGGRARVLVSDGRLSLRSAAGADNNKLCSIEIIAVDGDNG